MVFNATFNNISVIP